jgi:hypothetical protein
MLSGVTLTTADAARGVTLRPKPDEDSKGKPVKCKPPSCVVPLAEGRPSADDPLMDLATPPIARRTFSRDEEVVVFVEAYENGRTSSAHRLTVAAALEGDGARIVPIASEARAVSADAPLPQSTAFTLRLPLRDVAPGQYLLRIEAQSDAGDGRSVARTLPIEVK